MATIYLHNAIYPRNPSETEHSYVHSRNISTISDTTLFTSTTIHSQPTEPLLHASTPQTTNYDDQIDHIPRTREEIIEHVSFEDPLMTDDNPMNEAGKKGYWATKCRRPSKRWIRLKLGLQASLAAWAIYNTVRYFLAFVNSTNQTFCLALGTSAGVSFSLAFISFLLAIRDGNEPVHSLTPSYLPYVLSTLDYLSSFCLLSPAVVNFALVFIWKHSTDPHFNLNNRCHLDIDVVWSVSNTLCNKSPHWAFWLTLSILRLVLTLVAIIGYHILSSLYHRPRRKRSIRGFRSPTSETSTSEGPVPLSLNLPIHRDLSNLHQLSESTLCGTARGESSPQNLIHLARSRSSGLSQNVSPADPITLDRSTTVESENEHDLSVFVDHFRSMVSQISQETDEALNLSRSEHSPSPENMNDIPIRDLPPSYEEDPDDTHVSHFRNSFNLPPVPPTLGYNEFGLPYPPDQNVWVLSGYVRRMPTIESFGSSEVASSIAPSSHRIGESIFTSSRPPTRNTLLSWNSADHDDPNSEPPSRPNSFSARAEILMGLSNIVNTTSEHGELLGRTSPARRLSTPISVDPALSDSYSSSATNVSRGTSYHTATSEPSLPPGLSLDTQPRTPLWVQQDILSDSDQPP